MVEQDRQPFFDFATLKSRTVQIILTSTFLTHFGMFTPILLMVRWHTGLAPMYCYSILCIIQPVFLLRVPCRVTIYTAAITNVFLLTWCTWEFSTWTSRARQIRWQFCYTIFPCMFAGIWIQCCTRRTPGGAEMVWPIILVWAGWFLPLRSGVMISTAFKPARKVDSSKTAIGSAGNKNFEDERLEHTMCSK